MAPQTQLASGGGARQSWWVVHLGEAKLWLKTLAVLRLHNMPEYGFRREPWELGICNIFPLLPGSEQLFRSQVWGNPERKPSVLCWAVRHSLTYHQICSGDWYSSLKANNKKTHGTHHDKYYFLVCTVCMSY